MAVLKFGSKRLEVERLQKRLKEKEVSPGNVDRDFGLGTEAAFIAFQKSAGLLADGTAGLRSLE